MFTVGRNWDEGILFNVLLNKYIIVTRAEKTTETSSLNRTNQETDVPIQ